MVSRTCLASAATMVMTLTLPLGAAAQTGILHKRVPAMHKSLPSATTPGTIVPRVANASAGSISVDSGGSVSSTAPLECIVVPLPDGTGNGAIVPPIAIMPAMPGVPSPIDGDGIVHIMPIGPPEFVGFPALGPGIDGAAVATAVPGLGHAVKTPAVDAQGLQRATMATAMAADRMPAVPQSVPPAHAAGRGLLPRGMSVRSPMISGAAPEAGRSGVAVPASISPVGHVPGSPAPRWRDRFRFSSPFGK